MIIPKIDQDLAIIKATQVQFENGYHLTDQDIKDFNRAVDNLNKHPLRLEEPMSSLGYRADQIKNHLTTHDSLKLKITNVNSGTKWLNVTTDEVAEIAKLLNKGDEKS